MAIYFYSNPDQYGALSNFSPHGIEMDDVWWPTVEHYLQAQKFANATYRDKTRAAPSPKQAKTLGRSRQLPIRSDWDEARDDIMVRACLKKSQTHQDVRKLLLSTGDEELIKNAANDYYWGCGRSGSGQNKLGQILMRIRDQLLRDQLRGA